FAHPTRRGGDSRTKQSEAEFAKAEPANRKGRDAMRIIRFCVAFALICAVLPAAAQEKYPNRPVHFIVSFAAGGSNDIIARVLCDWLSEHLGQQFIVENRTGASGNVGAQSVVTSAPDG